MRPAVLALTLLSSGCAAFGSTPSGARLTRMAASPQWSGDGFENPQPLWNDVSASTLAEVMFEGSRASAPSDPDDIPVVRGDGRRFDTPPATGLRVTWFGHSSLLVEIDGYRVLTDPVWGERASPFSWLGPKRWYPPPIALDALPRVDAVVISHDHYDHLDHPTIEVLRGWDTTFFVPLGVGAHLEGWGVPPERIVELDWWERRSVRGLEIVCTPARHASGRGLLDQNATLWAGWALLGPKHRAFFSGDTGLFDDMQTIGERLGPFDVTMIEVGAYNRAWPDWHIGPEQAVLAHRWLRGRVLLPIHWGLFDLAAHSWVEPVQRVILAAHEAGARLRVPRPGESVEPSRAAPLHRWWPRVPWESAAQHPVRSTHANGAPARTD